jgi:hypothetical protein
MQGFGFEIEDAEISSLKPRTSRLAVASCVLGVLSFVACIFWPVPAIPAIICGIAALIRIRKYHGGLTGKGYAITGLILPVISFGLLYVFISGQGRLSSWVICGARLHRLGTAMKVYAANHDGRLPFADHWCDELITHANAGPELFLCPDSDAVGGESAYAMNIYAAGKNPGELPSDMVLLFETEAGKETGFRNTPVNTRLFYSFVEKQDSEWTTQNKKKKVYLTRWNQVGQLEMISVFHKKYKQSGCNVLFVNGNVNWISADEIPTLRWTVQEPNQLPPHSN